jgi:hypothetical protein
MHFGYELPNIVFWGAIVLFVLIGSYFKYKTRESQHRLLEKLAEKGQAISPELLANFSREDQRGNGARGGVVLMFIGIGLGLFFWAMGGGGGYFQGEHVPNWLPMIGVIPFMIGLGLLLTGLFDRRTPK